MDWIANALARIVASEIGRGKVDKITGVPTVGVPTVGVPTVGVPAGVPFATLVSQKLAIPILYYGKERKEHGVRKKIEGDMERNDAHNIEPHLLFSIPEAFVWLREVELLSDQDYRIIRGYIDAERNGGFLISKMGAFL